MPRRALSVCNHIPFLLPAVYSGPIVYFRSNPTRSGLLTLLGSREGPPQLPELAFERALPRPATPLLWPHLHRDWGTMANEPGRRVGSQPVHIVFSSVATQLGLL